MVQQSVFNRLVRCADGLQRQIVTPGACLAAVVCGAILNFMPANEMPRTLNDTTPRSANFSHRESADEASTMERSFSQIVLEHLPPGTIVIVGSTDLSASLHSFSLQTSEASPFTQASAAAIQASRLSHPVVVHAHRCRSSTSNMPCNRDQSMLTSTSMPAVVCSATAGPAADGLSAYHLSACQPASHLYRRRFLSPEFTDQGVISRPMQAICIHQSMRSLIYCSQELLTQADAGQQQRLQSDAARIGIELDKVVMPAIESMLRPVADVDQNQHLTILISRLDRRTDVSDTPIQGCVRADDLLSPDQIQTGDIIYLDHKLPTGRNLRALLSHEASHVAVYSAVLEYLQQNPGSTLDEACGRMPAWMNEAIAHAVERRLAPGSDNFRPRIEAYRRATALTPVVAPAKPFQLSERRGGTRAAATLFLESLLGSESGMSALLSLEQPAIGRIEALGRTTFPEVFRRWCISMAESMPEADWANSSDSGRQNPGREFCHLVGNATCEHLELRGTAACYLKLEDGIRQLSITAADAAQLQITVLADGQTSR